MGIKVIVNSSSPNRVSVNNQQRSTVRTLAVAAAQIKNISEMQDVDASSPNTNETLVFDETLNKYVVKVLPVVDGGSF